MENVVRESYGDQLREFYFEKADPEKVKAAKEKARILIDELESQIRLNIMKGKEPIATKSSLNTTFMTVDSEFDKQLQDPLFGIVLKDTAKSEKLDLAIQQAVALNPDTRTPIAGLTVVCTFQ